VSPWLRDVKSQMLQVNALESESGSKTAFQLNR
jgi:hypothetical protein